jgi:diaminohydroxyphosphoribosylaminopyrimidine deaminase/5-amino-6-(5-phosphoribosylamino)uracil reductase
VAPNPLVGAVLLREGQIVAEGFHAEFGGHHAEVEALSACADPAGTTCVVNLEPCGHVGKTAACADALAAAGVARVVFAVRDPDPEAQGGAEQLRHAGVDVEEGVGRDEGAALNAAFLWRHARPDRPFIALKLATSLDGYVADFEGISQWLSGPAARDYVHWLRAGFDAIAVGRRTAEVDDPELTVRGALRPRVPPVRVVFAREGAVSRDLRLVQTATTLPTVVFAEPSVVPRLERDLASTGVTVAPAATLSMAVQRLREGGTGSVLVEGGGTVATALLEEHLVDRVYWIQTPVWLGRGLQAFGPHTPTTLDGASKWVVTERRALGSDTLLVVDRELCSPEL